MSDPQPVTSNNGMASRKYAMRNINFSPEVEQLRNDYWANAALLLDGWGIAVREVKWDLDGARGVIQTVYVRRFFPIFVG
jgi:hypothetical protein